MKRRDFITLLAGATAVSPTFAYSQQPQRMRRVSVLMGRLPNDPEAEKQIVALRRGLELFGWFMGRNLAVEYRWHQQRNC